MRLFAFALHNMGEHVLLHSLASPILKLELVPKRPREKIDVLANAAEIMDSFEAADVISDQVWDRVMGVNLMAPTKLIRAVLPFMKAKKNGAIINVASKAGMSGIASGVAYTAVSEDFLINSPIPPNATSSSS